MQEERRVEVLCGIVGRAVKPIWQEILFTDLQKGDQFRMFFPDGTPMEDDGYTIFKATSDPYICPQVCQLKTGIAKTDKNGNLENYDDMIRTYNGLSIDYEKGE
jgi:hypothetical protein